MTNNPMQTNNRCQAVSEVFAASRKSAVVNRKRGQSVIEILIAITIFTIGLSSMIFLIFGGQSVSLDSEEASQAVRLARQELESIEASSSYNFNGLVSASGTVNEFFKQITVTDAATNTKQVMSRVSWSLDPLRTQAVELTTLVTNWYQSQATGGDTGGNGPSGNWCNPKTFGSLDLGPGETGTGIDVIGTTAYMTATASVSSKPDFFIINVSSSSNPTIISSLDTGPGLNALDAVSGYVFAANNSTTAQLQVIDVSNASSPNLVASLTLSGVSGSGAIGNAIFYSNKKIYIGTEKATGPEFHIIDVSAPTAPVELGSKTVGGEVNSIYVNGNIAYVAVHDDPRLLVLDVSNPASITQVGSYSTGGQESDGSYYLNNKEYLGAEKGSKPELFILDVSSVNPSKLGSIDLSGSLNDIKVAGNLAFLATDDTNAEFQVWNVANPSNPTLCSSFNFPNVANSLDYENNLVYVAVRSNDALRIVTSQ